MIRELTPLSSGQLHYPELFLGPFIRHISQVLAVRGELLVPVSPGGRGELPLLTLVLVGRHQENLPSGIHRHHVPVGFSGEPLGFVFHVHPFHLVDGGVEGEFHRDALGRPVGQVQNEKIVIVGVDDGPTVVADSRVFHPALGVAGHLGHVPAVR